MKIKKLNFFFVIICLIQIFYIFNSRIDFKYEILKNPFHANSGIKYSISPEIIELKELLNKNNVKEFNLSKKITKNTYLYQRSVEFAYPLKLNKASEYLFLFKYEDMPSTCKEIQTGKYLKLIMCN